MKTKTKRALGISCVGKGDRCRVKNFEAYRDNYDNIKWGSSKDKPIKKCGGKIEK